MRYIFELSVLIIIDYSTRKMKNFTYSMMEIRAHVKGVIIVKNVQYADILL